MGGKRRGVKGWKQPIKTQNKCDKSFNHQKNHQKKHSRYIPPSNQGWEEEEEGRKDESSHSKYKIKVTKVSIIKKKSKYIPPICQGWEGKEEGRKDESAIQDTK